jgi:DNA repair exonuclease SbcCD ATPase subunit
MLELKEIEWRNFMSYGDYDTRLELNTLGQCLITGEVLGEEKAVFDESGLAKIKKSNGAGKSTLPNVILWTLFGRTMHSASPGDKVINWFTGKNCRAKITFKNGDFIVRSRKINGQNELIYVKDGDETNVTSDTLSTAKNQQAELNRLFNLDWDLLCGSMFFNQYSKPWMEMADQTRKKAIERALHVDRFEYRAKVAKGKCDTLDAEVRRKRQRIENLHDESERLAKELERIKNPSAQFDTGRAERQKQALQNAVAAKQKRDAIQRPDLKKLQKKWDVVKQIRQKIEEMQETANIHSRRIGGLEGAASSDKQKIKLWKAKAGKVCGVCEQEVPKSHIAAKIEPIQEALENTKAEIAKETEALNVVTAKIKQAKQILANKSPDTSMQDARSIHQQWDRHDKEIDRLRQEAKNISTEENPHTATITDIMKRQEKCEADIKQAEKDIEKTDHLNRHYHYVFKAWNDRTKIKSFVFQEHIPYINKRLKHYLEVFGLDIQIELTPALGIKSNMWGYEFESGGERKRTDVAFMLAMFDFHEQMYGRQSNVLVLDEVDGRLDDDGIDSLINVIKNDLASKVETIMIISHRNMMCDTFPTELRVKRMGTDEFRGFSQLEAA